jgi:hypothetical protein
MTNCPKFIEMQKMFHGKFLIVAKFHNIGSKGLHFELGTIV